MRIGAGDGRPPSGFRHVMAGRRGGRRVEFRREIALLVTLGQNRDREIRAVPLAQAAADAVRGLDDRVVREDERVLGADLDADIAALAPLVGPADVDVVNDGGGAMGTSFGNVWGSRGCSPDSIHGPRV